MPAGGGAIANKGLATIRHFYHNLLGTFENYRPKYKLTNYLKISKKHDFLLKKHDTIYIGLLSLLNINNHLGANSTATKCLNWHSFSAHYIR